MPAYRFSQRSLNNLKGVHPKLVELMTDALSRVPYDFIVTEGLRTPSRQKALLTQGKSKTLNSYHLPQKDGYGHAVDIAIIPPWGGVTWENKFYEEEASVILRLAKEKGLQITWGGVWKSLCDTPHFQLEPRSLPVV